MKCWHKLVIVWNVTLDSELDWTTEGAFYYFLLHRLCSTHSILNSVWATLTFAALNLTFRGHEAGRFHAYWVIISRGLERNVLQFLRWQLLLFSVYATVLVVHIFCYKCLKRDCSFGIKRFLVSCYYGISLHFLKRG